LFSNSLTITCHSGKSTIIPTIVKLSNKSNLLYLIKIRTVVMLKFTEKQCLRNELYYARIKHKEVAKAAQVSESAVSQFFRGGTVTSPAIETAALSLLKQYYEKYSAQKQPILIQSYFFPGLSSKNNEYNSAMSG
jgi:hypothetical protein